MLHDYDVQGTKKVSNEVLTECSVSLAKFGKVFFPQVFTSDFCSFHNEVFKALEDNTLKAERKDKKYYFLRAAPRGHGKSQILSFLYPLWCICFGYAKNILIVSDTAPQAAQFIMAIKDELDDNELLIDTFGNKHGGIWKETKIVTTDRIQLTGKGAGQKLRGIKYRQFRPDVIIIDDLENDENVETEQQRQKLLNWFTKALLPCGSISVKIFYIGTVLNYESLLNRMLTTPEYSIWDRKRYQAVEVFSKSPLWEKWEDILSDEKNPKAAQKAHKFYLVHKNAMLKGTKLLWEDKQPDHYEDLMIMRHMNTASFDSEYQNDPVSESERDFQDDWFQYWTVLPDITGVYIGVDPSMAKTNKSDVSSIIVVGKGVDNYLYVLNANIARRKPDKIIDDLIRECITYRNKLVKVGIEAIQFQSFFAQECAKRGLAMNMPIPIEQVTNMNDKQLRLKGLIPFIKNGYIKFHATQTRLLAEFKHFPKGADDGMDGLKMAVDLIYPVSPMSAAGFCFGSIKVGADKKTQGKEVIV